MPDSDNSTDPVNRASVRILHSLTDRWCEYSAVALTEPDERAIDRMVGAGLVEAGGTLSFAQPGIATRFVIEGRWGGRILEDQVIAHFASVPEWFVDGKLRGRVAMIPDIQRVRLTGVGLTAQGDVRSPDRQHIVLRLLAIGATEPGRLLADVQRIERPVPPNRGRMND